MPYMDSQDVLNAIREGVSDAFVAMIRNGTDMPTADILEMIRKGVKDAMLEHLDATGGVPPDLGGEGG